jgi:hypothetical protein
MVRITYRFIYLFAVPSLALFLGMLLARGGIMLPGVFGSDWQAGLVKAIVFPGVYICPSHSGVPRDSQRVLILEKSLA